MGFAAHSFRSIVWRFLASFAAVLLPAASRAQGFESPSTYASSLPGLAGILRSLATRAFSPCLSVHAIPNNVTIYRNTLSSPFSLKPGNCSLVPVGSDIDVIAEGWQGLRVFRVFLGVFARLARYPNGTI